MGTWFPDDLDEAFPNGLDDDDVEVLFEASDRIRASSQDPDPDDGGEHRLTEDYRREVRGW